MLRDMEKSHICIWKGCTWLQFNDVFHLLTHLPVNKGGILCWQTAGLKRKCNWLSFLSSASPTHRFHIDIFTAVFQQTMSSQDSVSAFSSAVHIPTDLPANKGTVSINHVIPVVYVKPYLRKGHNLLQHVHRPWWLSQVLQRVGDN